MNPDLPQFEHGVSGWTEITLAYDLAPYEFAVPVAIQVFSPTRRVLTTGLVSSTEDQFAPNSTDNDEPLVSVIYFQDAEPLRIIWKDVQAVIAMVGVATGEEGPRGSGSEEEAEGGGD